MPDVIEDSTECSAPQSEEMSSSLVQSISTEVQNVNNLAVGVSLDTTQNQNTKANKPRAIDTILNSLSRCYYFGIRLMELDPSRVELLDAPGFHERTTVRISNIQKTFKIPGVTKTRPFTFKLGAFDTLDNVTPESSPIKAIVSFLADSITIGRFASTAITQEGTNPLSRAMYLKTRTEQEQHVLMRRQLQRIVNHVPAHIMLGVIFQNLNPNHDLFIPAPIVNRIAVRDLGRLVRANLLPKYVGIFTPRYVNTEIGTLFTTIRSKVNPVGWCTN